MKGAEVMLHQNTLLAARVSELEQQLDTITKRKARKRKRIQHGGTMEYSVGSAKVATEASTATQQSKKTRRSVGLKQAQPAVRYCSSYGGIGHNARTYQKDIEGSSESDESIIFTGSLFDSNENE